MDMIKLFSYRNENGEQAWITNDDLRTALCKVHASDCEFLLIHTDVAAFGCPNPELKRKAFFQAIYDVILSLGVKTIAFPAFTFSFANNEDFSVNDSTAKYMGGLNEYVRKQPGVVRSLDPMMSVIVVGERAESFYKIGKQCMGKDGIFDRLHTMDNVKFLFLGAKPTHCFTHAHYVEAVYGVPYRFEKWYTGMVTDRDGNTYEDSFSVYAACQGVTPAAMTPFEKHMKLRNAYMTQQVGLAEIVCFSEKDAYQAMWDALDENIHGFLTRPFTQEDLVKEVKYNPERTVMVP